MMDKLRVSFNEPGDGWIRITLQHGAKTVGLSASYIYNSFFPLVDALYQLKMGAGEAAIAWQCEPSEYEFQFARQADVVRLQVLLFPDSRRSIFDQIEPELSVTGSYDEVCLPLWRALRQLQGRFPEAEWEARWQRPFPTKEMELLTTELGK